MSDATVWWILGLIILWFVISKIYAGYRQVTATPTVICSACGTRGIPQRITPGSTLIELVLWLCFLLPGLIYSIWRLSARRNACAICAASALVPLNSPMGKQLTQRFPQ